MRRILSFSFGPLSVAVLGLLIVPIMAWSFSQEVIGRLAIFQVVISFSWLLLGLGLDQSYVRAYFDATEKIRLLKAVFYPGIVLGLTLMFADLALGHPIINNVFHGELYSGINYVIYITIISTYLVNFLSLTLRMEMRGFLYSLVQILNKVIFLVILLFFSIYYDGAGFKELVTAVMVSIFLSSIFVLYKTNALGIFCDRQKFDSKYSIELLSYGLPLLISGVIFWGLISVDRILLAKYSSYSEVGLYSISVNFAAPSQILLGIFSTILAPLVFGWLDNPHIKKKISSVAKLSVFSVATIWVLSSMFSWTIDYFLPLQYGQVKYILLLCMAYPLLYGLSEVGGIGINVQKKTIYMVPITGLCLFINVFLNILLIPKYGAVGAAVSSAFTFFIYFLIRSEVGSLLWFRIYGYKEYMLLLLVLVNCTLISLEIIKFINFIALNFILLLFILLFYRNVTTAVRDLRSHH